MNKKQKTIKQTINEVMIILMMMMMMMIIIIIIIIPLILE
jgi:hypothetical protein